MTSSSAVAVTAAKARRASLKSISAVLLELLLGVFLLFFFVFSLGPDGAWYMLL